MMENSQACMLDWDSNFFGIRCARIDLFEAVNEIEFDSLLNVCDKSDLIYIINHNCLPTNNYFISKLHAAYIVDTNIQFQKSVFNTGAVSSENFASIKVAHSLPPDNQICDIAESVFEHSRFIYDTRLCALGGRYVYREWVKNAFNRADKIFAIDYSHDSQDIKGFVLYSIDKQTLTIELIGTNRKYREQGVGGRLWRLVEKEAASCDCTQIEVGTQITNPACAFYQKCGCRFVSGSQVYHWWKTV